MVIKCLVCSNKYGPLSSVTFHRFPKDSERFYKWVKICRRPDLLNEGPSVCYKKFKLCSEHFLKTDFINCRLSSVAVPSVFKWSDVECSDVITDESIPSTSGIMADS
ncbi:THAP domain-containing protein 6-like, partial [Myzus persicae]|uniref:THAP domain-containing protein 6-like n=1 Tax=Myzus persicae TaxID=13164 RepID=UPI000B931272